MRCRYEVFLDGRLLRITERVFVGSSHAAEEPGEDTGQYIDGRYRWRVDESDVAEDVAVAMFTHAGQPPPMPLPGHQERRPS